MILVGVEDKIQFAVGKEDAPADVVMGGLFGESLDAVDDVLVDVVAAEPIDQLVVVDFFVGGVLNGVGVDDHPVLDGCLLILPHLSLLLHLPLLHLPLLLHLLLSLHFLLLLRRLALHQIKIIRLGLMV
jgi:hypothetical protein